MRYSRNRKTYRRSSSRRRFYKKYQSYRSMAYTAYKGVKMLKGIVNSEKKYMEVHNSVNVTTTPAITLLSVCAQGDDETNRNGRSVLAKHVYLKGTLELNSATPVAIIRVMVFIDNNSNSAAPTAADVLDSLGGLNVNSLLNQDNAGSRFQILYDKRHTISDGTMQDKPIEIWRRLPPMHHVKWDGTTAAQADCVSGHVYLLLVSTLAVDPPAIQYNSRIGFYDN